MFDEDPLDRQITRVPLAHVCGRCGRLYAAGYRDAEPADPQQVPPEIQTITEESLVVRATSSPCECGFPYFRVATFGELSPGDSR